jgi:hypothetical protein
VGHTGSPQQTGKGVEHLPKSMQRVDDPRLFSITVRAPMHFEYRDFVIECSTLCDGAGFLARVIVSYSPLDETNSPAFKSDLARSFSTELQAIYFARHVGEMWYDEETLVTGCGACSCAVGISSRLIPRRERSDSISRRNFSSPTSVLRFSSLQHRSTTTR